MEHLCVASVHAWRARSLSGNSIDAAGRAALDALHDRVRSGGVQIVTESQRRISTWLEVFFARDDRRGFRHAGTIQVSFNGETKANERYSEDESGVKWPMPCAKADFLGRELGFKLLKGEAAGCHGTLTIRDDLFDTDVEVPLTRVAAEEEKPGVSTVACTITTRLQWGERGRFGLGTREDIWVQG